MDWRRKRVAWALGVLGICIALFSGSIEAAELRTVNRYSPLNSERAPRRATEYIVLHTTEGPAKGSLDKLRRYGEAHYMVDKDGTVYRVIDRNRIAMHAGRSMWAGRTNIDEVSLGIEVVGYHDKPLTRPQLTALKELLRQLQSVYRVPDSKVLPHSMVAYGRPNRWHRSPHRGRKRCAMLLARESVRETIGLTEKPSFDPDVRAGRLVVADHSLERVLFGPDPGRRGGSARAAEPSFPEDPNVIGPGRSAWDIAREQYDSDSTVYTFPDGATRRGSDISNWSQIPVGTKVRVAERVSESASSGDRVQILGRDGANAWEIAGGAYNEADTIYFLPDGRVRQGDQMSRGELDTLPEGARMLVGYVHGGLLTARRRAYEVVGAQWNLASTFYRYPDGSIRSGLEVDEKSIPERTMVFFPR